MLMLGFRRLWAFELFWGGGPAATQHWTAIFRGTSRESRETMVLQGVPG